MARDNFLDNNKQTSKLPEFRQILTLIDFHRTSHCLFWYNKHIVRDTGLEIDGFDPSIYLGCHMDDFYTDC